MTVTIYHNPRCSKSRETLALLESRGLAVKVIEYLKSPPDKRQLAKILKLLGMKPREVIRKNESEYRDLKLDDERLTDAGLIDAIVAHPVLMQRPIVLANGKAAIGRPPEDVLAIL